MTFTTVMLLRFLSASFDEPFPAFLTGSPGRKRHGPEDRYRGRFRQIEDRKGNGDRIMKVLHAIGTPPGAGAGHQLRLLVRALPHHSEVVMLCADHAIAAALRADGVEVHDLGS